MRLRASLHHTLFSPLSLSHTPCNLLASSSPLSLLAASLSLAAADHIDTLPQVSQTLSGYADIDSIKRRLTSLPLHIIEGIWQFPADGATVVIERFNPDNTRDDGAARYRIVILRSPQRSMIPAP